MRVALIELIFDIRRQIGLLFWARAKETGLRLWKHRQTKSSGMQSDIEGLTAELSSGKFQEVLDKASLLLPLAKTRLHRAACHFLIGAALNELGSSDEALPHFLEATLTYPTDQPFLVGHAQLEVSEILNKKD